MTEEQALLMYISMLVNGVRKGQWKSDHVMSMLMKMFPGKADAT